MGSWCDDLFAAGRDQLAAHSGRVTYTLTQHLGRFIMPLPYRKNYGTNAPTVSEQVP